MRKFELANLVLNISLPKSTKIDSYRLNICICYSPYNKSPLGCPFFEHLA